MNDERRKNRRVPVLIEVHWEGKAGKYEARTSDLSERGCFVDTIGQAVLGERILFKLRLPSGEWLEFEGDVTFASPRIGFGIEFKNITEAAKKKLEWLVKAGTYQEDKKPL